MSLAALLLVVGGALLAVALLVAPVVEFTPFQRRVLAVPDQYDSFLGGSRGGGKSFTLMAIGLRHCEQYRERARVLYLRQTYPGLRDFELLTRDLFGSLYGGAARYNSSEHVWRLPGGAVFELGQLHDPGDLQKYLGRSFSLVLLDELTEWPEPQLVDQLRGSLRSVSGVPVRLCAAGNPGGPGHGWVARRYVFRGSPWKPFREPETGRSVVYCPSTFEENPHINREEYRRQLEAACAGDAELLRGWRDGDWSIARGAFFAGVLSEVRSAIDPWPPGFHRAQRPIWFDTPEQAAEWSRRGRAGEWGLFLAHDFGVSAPSVTYVVARSPGAVGPDGRFYARDSLLALDELATNEPGSLSRGMGYTVPRLADEIRVLCERWAMAPEGVADDAIFARSGSSTGSIGEEFRRLGVSFYPAGKGDRRHGWEVLRRLMADAGKPDRPGLYVARSCSYFWQTAPFAARDPRRPDDVESRGPDHGLDAMRYACVGEVPSWGSEEFLV